MNEDRQERMKTTLKRNPHKRYNYYKNGNILLQAIQPKPSNA